jgi:enediyne biosynthesis protein E4
LVKTKFEFDRNVGPMNSRIPYACRNLCRAVVLGIAAFSLSISTGCRREENPDQSAAAEAPRKTESKEASAGERAPAPPAEPESADKNTSTAIRFVDQTRESGVEFAHRADRTARRLMPEIMGSGVLVGDFNRDGAPDLVLINGGHVENPIRPPDSQNRIFLNDGQGKFRDVTAEWGLLSTGYGMGGAVGDYDNDGCPDLYLTTWGGGDRLLRNTGTGFQDATGTAGLATDSSWKSSAAFFDANNDGWLDLYVVRYVVYDPATALQSFFMNEPVYSTPLLFAGLPDQLWINRGDGTFQLKSDLPDSSRESYEGDWKGLAVGTSDLNQDGKQDIYVANDSCRNLLFINQGNAVFDEVGRLNGVAYGDSGKEQAGMGVDFADVDSDGKLDIVCTNFQGEPANLYCQTKDTFFVDRTDSRGIGSSTRNRLQWGCKFLDADNDGDQDLVIANGHLYDQIESLVTGATFGQPNSLFENDGKGQFTDVSKFAGTALQDASVSRGLAIADLNNDGMVDFVVNNNNGMAQIAINQSNEPGNFASFWLEGCESNRSAIGTRLTAKSGDREITREIFGGTSYLSAHDMRVHFGLGDAGKIASLEVSWPSGKVQSFTDIEANQFYFLKEGGTLSVYQPGLEIRSPAE